MRNYLCTLMLMLSTVAAFAQSATHKLGLSIGAGPQDYKGDLGNGFKINNPSVEWRGVIAFNASYYLSRSLDAAMFVTGGDFGYCQPDDVANKPVDEDKRCPGCNDRVGLGNLNSRFYSVGTAIRYKFSNGYLLKENSRFKPYAFAGVAVNRVVDRMKMNCVIPGDYLSVNGGAGVKYYLTKSINVGYQFSLGYFASDKVDRMSHGSNDMYMQNVLTLGIDLL